MAECDVIEQNECVVNSRKIFELYPNNISEDIKIRVFEILENFRKKRELHFPPSFFELEKEEQEILLKLIRKLEKDPRKILTDSYGFIIVLGWSEEHNKHYFIPDPFQNIFAEKKIHINSDNAEEAIFSTRYFDNAVLINREGYITDSGVMIVDVDPSKMFRAMNISIDMHHNKGHARHMTAIAASWYLKNTTIFTLSEETNILRIYQDGKRIYSSDEKEQKQSINSLVV